jgi:Domain of unknown function (DUF4287)
MGLNHSEETHQLLVARIPSATGRPMREWFSDLDEQPGFLRFEERVQWLCDEFGIAHGHATAIAHEHDIRRAHRSFE